LPLAVTPVLPICPNHETILPVTTPFVFQDYRGLVQLRLETPEDLEHIRMLEPARWSSTSVPVDQLLCDPALLDYVDGDKNSRIRVHELVAAYDWLRLRLKNTQRIIDRTDTVHLDDLDTSLPEAAQLKRLARKRIKASGKESGPGTTISLADIRAFRDGYAKKFPNGDGVVTAAQIEDPDLSRLAAMVVEATGGDADLSGEAGVDEGKLDAFVALGRARLAWHAEGRLLAGEKTSAILPFGEDTAAAFALVDALAGKLDQFFAQCDLLGQGKAAEERLLVTAESLAPLDVRDPEAIRGFLRDASLARPNSEGVLVFDGWLNPLFADDARRFAADVLPRALGASGPMKRLERAGWEKVRALFEPYRAFVGKKPTELPGGLDGEALAKLLDGPLHGRLRALVIEDRQASAELLALSDLEKLALLQRWILDLANNMVSFPALFAVGERCLFEVGTLVLDGREINLCVRVPDKAAHKPVAEGSNIFTVYVDLDRKEDGEWRRMEIAAGVTSGTRRGIAVNKRGVFYDRDGKEWDAKVTDIIVKPISIWEAAISPFVKIRDFMAERIEKLLGGRLDAMEKSMEQSADARVAGAAPAPPLTPPATHVHVGGAMPGSAQGLLVGGGIAFAAIGSTLAFALKTLTSTGPLHIIGVVAGIVGAIMSVSGLLGWLKLRKRDVSTLLEASGWAFNVRIYLRRNLSLRFTRVPPLPKGSVRKRQILPVFASAEQPPSRARIVFTVLVIVFVLLVGWHYREPIRAWLGPLLV
jgi:hypothetical protein